MNGDVGGSSSTGERDNLGACDVLEAGERAGVLGGDDELVSDSVPSSA